MDARTVKPQVVNAVKCLVLISVLILCIACSDSGSDSDEGWYPNISEEDFDENTLALINDYRESKDKRTLTFSEDLWYLAMEHADEMYDNDHLDHDGFWDRVGRSGSDYCVENVASGYLTSEDVVEAWRKSSGHNKNMLDSHIRRGAVAHDGSYSVFFACD